MFVFVRIKQLWSRQYVVLVGWWVNSALALRRRSAPLARVPWRSWRFHFPPDQTRTPEMTVKQNVRKRNQDNQAALKHSFIPWPASEGPHRQRWCDAGNQAAAWWSRWSPLAEKWERGDNVIWSQMLKTINHLTCLLVSWASRSSSFILARRCFSRSSSFS